MYFIQGDDYMSILSHKLQGQEHTNSSFATVLLHLIISLVGMTFGLKHSYLSIYFIFPFLMIYFSLEGINLVSFPLQ